MTPYVMRSKTDCGFRAIISITGKTQPQVEQAAHGANYNDMRDDIKDWPPLIKKTIRNLGMEFWEPDLDDILMGAAKSEKTMILVHSDAKPFAVQHYVVLSSVTPTHVLCWWGKDEHDLRASTHLEFQHLMLDGFPNFAVEVGRPGGKFTWWEKLSVRIGRALVWLWGLVREP